MLPQFGFIVAQAGADSIHPNNTNMSQASSQPSQLTKSYPTPSTTTNQSNEHFPYYTRHPSPPPPPPSSTPLLPPPLPYMYNSAPTREYYPPFDNNTHYRPLQPLPAQNNNGNYNPIDPYNWQPQPIQFPTSNTTTNTLVAQTSQRDEYVYEDPPYQPHYNSWQEEPIELNENKILRLIREFNDLMTWMDSEFWEQCDEIYREKLQSLQEEIQSIQQGTHSAFKETMTDIELSRERTIEYAEYYKNYELSLTKYQYDQEKAILQDEYENERHNLHDMVLQSIEDKKKQIKDDKDDGEFDVKELFRDAYSKVNNKRSLRKRANFDRHSSASPSRQERRRHNRQSTAHNIHAVSTTAEEEELETEFMNMKGGLPPRRPGAFTQTRR
ncbi:hypothetical protein MFLAVUS_011399 [Mucor flavus]|uniref:Uncharacterized protein n=1 Tax=Mucor flavus TaxID=439312 RepID=A0ABP9ZFE0_9FUNG